VNKKSLKKHSKTDWDRLDSMKDEDIDYSDIPELGEDFFKNAVVVMPQNKITITIRLDKDVLEWLKLTEPKYQTSINAILRSYMKAKIKTNHT